MKDYLQNVFCVCVCVWWVGRGPLTTVTRDIPSCSVPYDSDPEWAHSEHLGDNDCGIMTTITPALQSKLSWLPEQGDNVQPNWPLSSLPFQLYCQSQPTSSLSIFIVPQISHTFPHWPDLAHAVTSVGKCFLVVQMCYLLCPIPLLRKTSFC